MHTHFISVSSELESTMRRKMNTRRQNGVYHSSSSTLVMVTLAAVIMTTATRISPCDSFGFKSPISAIPSSSTSLMLSSLSSSSFGPITPMVAPRFDDFCEQVVGTWTSIDNNNNMNNHPQGLRPQGYEVEEVMRSCGGAIQGIRVFEKTISGDESNSNKNNNESIYHNRADDGFIYFDCGSYTQGPVHTVSSENNNDGDNNTMDILGSVSFGTIPKTRVLFHTSYSPAAGDDSSACSSTSSSYQTLIRMPANNDANAKDMEETVMTINNKPPNHNDVKWEKCSICCMDIGSSSSMSQPWMLQRAKWKKTNTDDESDDFNKKIKLENPNQIQFHGWMKIWDKFNAQKDTHNQNTMQNDNVLNFVKTMNAIWNDDDETENKNNKELTSLLLENTSRIIQMGATCMTNNQVKTIIRCYNDENVLKGVVLQQGKILVN